MKILVFLTTATLVLGLCGCGKKIVTVTGEVRYEDKPAKDIAVLFEPKSNGVLVAESGVAVTTTDGRFRLESSSRKSGIEPGKYGVYLGWKNPATVEDGGAGPVSGTANKVTSPYQFPEERKDIVVEVVGSGKNHFVFKVSPKEVLCE